MNYVIVGNGPAGTAAAEAIREVDPQGKITILSEEGVGNYSKPLISYLLAQKVKKNQMAQREEDFYYRNRVDLLLNRRAVKIDVKEKNVILADKKKISFDRLLIATGGAPIPLSVPGDRSKGVYTFTQLRDAAEVDKYLRENEVREAVVVGGGLIGLKTTEALMERGITVTIVELADRILSATFDRKASAIIEEALRKKGCRVFLKTTAAKITADRQGKVKAVVLKDKTRVSCTMVVFAVGVVANTALLKGSPIRQERGIVVDNTLQTSIPGIYAAGDCCQVPDFFGRASRVVPIWPNAVRQGKVAGYNMAGRKKEYEGALAMNSVELCGIPTISVGLTDPPEEDGYEKIELANEKKSVYKKLVIREGVIVGALFVGDISRAGVYTGMIKEGMKVGDFREYLLKDNFGLIYLPKEYRKHFVTGEGMEV